MATHYSVTPELLALQDFGVTLGGGRTRFRVWSPSSELVRVALYDNWNTYYRKEIPMTREPDGCWVLELDGELDGKYYNYLVSRHGQNYEVLDPWVKSAAPNSKRGMILDPSKVNPPGWGSHTLPEPVPPGHALIYEAHVRDFSMHPESGMRQRGKYLCLTERGTRTSEGSATGVDHLLELGVTHLHLLPVYDFATVDELEPVEYNWGYDPVLYNAPEGSYATDPKDGRVRVLELKAAIQALHEAGIRVVLDVVYNHTYHGAKSNFNYLVPGYYYRQGLTGAFTNGSGVGNELATENLMVRKFIIDSLSYWLTEYRVDGFRFDLLGLYDQETVREICRTLTALRPDVLLYGEPWVGGDSGLPWEQQFLKGAQRDLPVAVFNDDFRNALKGDNDGDEEGFITGRTGKEAGVVTGLAGSIGYSEAFTGFAARPSESINYLSCHDNLSLFDKVVKLEGGFGFEILKAINRLGLGIILTAFGVPFLHMGSEFLRHKHGLHNTYNAPDSVNQVDWTLKDAHSDLVAYVSALIRFRRSQRIYAVDDPEVIREAVAFPLVGEGLVAMRVCSPYPEDFKEMLFIYNAGWDERQVNVPGTAGMSLFCCGEAVCGPGARKKHLATDDIDLPGIRMMIFVRKR